MATISSMARNQYMLYNLSQRYGGSMFSSSSASLAGASAASSAGSVMSGLVGIRQSLRDMVSSYETASKTFKTEFNSAMDDLTKAAAEIKKTDFNVGGEEAVTKTTDENGKTTVEKSDKLKETLKTIENFADKYNEAIDFFKENADVSKQTKNMATIFGDTTYRAKSLESIGLVVESDGKMKIDEDILTDALTKNPQKVASVLGKDGLADRANRHVSFAKSQANRLLPSLQSSMKGAYSSSSVYSGSSLKKISSYTNMSNLFNMWI